MLPLLTPRVSLPPRSHRIVGNQHPTMIVETTAMASVAPPPPVYQDLLRLPESVYERGHLSQAQMEALIYACQQHETRLASGARRGFLIGDGAGVGKGRTL